MGPCFQRSVGGEANSWTGFTRFFRINHEKSCKSCLTSLRPRLSPRQFANSPGLWGHCAYTFSAVYPVLFNKEIALAKMDVCTRPVCGCVGLPESQRAFVGVFETVPIKPTGAKWICKQTIKRMCKVCDQRIAGEVAVRRRT